MGRLFVPLKSEPFEWFRSGKKEWELRGISTRFNPDTVRKGPQGRAEEGVQRREYLRENNSGEDF